MEVEGTSEKWRKNYDHNSQKITSELEQRRKLAFLRVDSAGKTVNSISEVPINSVVIHVFTWCVLLLGHKWHLGMIINCMGHFHMKSQQPYYFVFQNSEKVAMFHTNYVGGELFPCVNASLYTQ